MSCNKKEILTGLEPYRDPFQIAYGYDQDTEEYCEAQQVIYRELERDISVDRMDQFHVLRMLSQGKPVESYSYLEKVLEE